jgi:hypothetical protein
VKGKDFRASCPRRARILVNEAEMSTKFGDDPKIQLQLMPIDPPRP